MKINENLETGDLVRLVHNELHIDEYKSKMGDDADIIVISFKVAGKEPAADLVSFIEKGYDWVLDADVSSGEKEGGDYLVFIEIERNAAAPDHVIEMLNDLVNLTEHELEDWRIRYQKSTEDYEATVESLQSVIPLSPEKYRAKYEKDSEEPADELSDEEKQALDRMKATAGVKVDTAAPTNEFTESLRIAAGIK